MHSLLGPGKTGSSNDGLITRLAIMFKVLGGKHHSWQLVMETDLLSFLFVFYSVRLVVLQSRSVPYSRGWKRISTFPPERKER
jgi:hypothetical protein